MFCNQCEQTWDGLGCSGPKGVCEKTEDIQSLQEILLYGLKGMAAYASHARRFGASDEEVSAFIEEALFSTMTNVSFDVPSMVGMVLKCGEMNLRVMQMLNDAHLERFGVPEPTEVYEGTREGPGILVTGHDLLDLENILKATEGSGINVYTHGEMLPGHSYPGLKKYPHLAGHFGGAWQLQKKEFRRFSGPIVVTTNCILIPHASYQDRVYTMRVVSAPGATAVVDDDFSAVIAAAKAAAPLREKHVKDTLVGFHFTQILQQAETIVEAVKSGAIKHFFVIGGCDGAEPGRNYYSDYAQATPDESVILTLGCGKYRIRDHEYGDIGGIPRLLDMGQCNDAYGAVQVALALADAFDTDVNSLPLTLNISWFEQKAVAVLLTLLHLGIKNIRLGPALPAFVSPGVLQILVDEFGLRGIGESAEADLVADMA
jgi:hydroxylamine reductase